MKRKGFLKNILGFIWQRKAYWLLPVIIMLILLIAFIAVGASPVMPFVYTIM